MCFCVFYVCLYLCSPQWLSVQWCGQCVLVCAVLMQHVAVYRSVLQCVAVSFPPLRARGCESIDFHIRGYGA